MLLVPHIIVLSRSDFSNFYLKGTILFYVTLDTLRKMGKSAGFGDFWDLLGG